VATIPAVDIDALIVEVETCLTLVEMACMSRDHEQFTQLRVHALRRYGAILVKVPPYPFADLKGYRFNMRFELLRAGIEQLVDPEAQL
jgi:hypothetical protein